MRGIRFGWELDLFIERQRVHVHGSDHIPVTEETADLALPISS